MHNLLALANQNAQNQIVDASHHLSGVSFGHPRTIFS
jgi:hypothetical protein